MRCTPCSGFALVGTQIALVRHMTQDEGNSFSDALSNTVVNEAATFTVIDLLAVAVIGLVFMIVEGRRLGMRFIWVYVVLTSPSPSASPFRRS